MAGDVNDPSLATWFLPDAQHQSNLCFAVAGSLRLRAAWAWLSSVAFVNGLISQGCYMGMELGWSFM